MSEVIKSFKGFDKDLKCRGYQFEIGKEYEEPDAKACDRGFHACEQPIEVFGYYAPGQSRYCEVEQSGKIDRKGDDSKVASSRIKIGAEVGILGIVKAQIEYVKAHTTTENTDPEKATAGNAGAATAGESGAATAGNRGAATAGYAGAATAGDYGAATAGNRGAATAGNRGAATAGNAGAATAGEYGAATAGESGAATAGESGAATSRGSSAVGSEGLAVARGNDVKVKGGLGAMLVLAEEEKSSYKVAAYKVEIVDGKRIKADTWYKLVDGEFVEVIDEEEKANVESQS